MKKIVYMTIILINLLQCSGQKNITKMKIFEKELVFPDISPEYKRLDSSRLKDFTEKKGLAIRQVTDRDFYRYEEYNKGEKIQYNFNDEDNIFGVARYIKIEPDDNKDFEKSIYFVEGRTYSVDGSLMKKGLSLMCGTSFLMYLQEYEYGKI